MEIGGKLRKLRESKNMSMYRLTQITGVSGHHIKGIEEGSRQPTIETLNRLLEPLGVTLAEFFNEDEDAAFLSEAERELISCFRTLPKKKADILLEFLKNFL